ncbi:MAG: ABC-2 type transport system permease protein [Alphaproteobacteria bacterium]|jgi:ABC-2 type transport system permease protein
MTAHPDPSLLSPLKPRALGRVNWIGLAALMNKEVTRFLCVWVQTVAAPIVTTMLFLAVFTLALGRSLQVVGGVPFTQFLAPGLIMMSMIQNAYANTSSSIVSSKMQGNIVDVVMAPLSAIELLIGYAFGGMARGLMVGVVVALAMTPFAGITLVHPLYALFCAVAGSLMLSFLGIIGGIWAEKHEQNAAVTNFIITPLAFLSGTFYSIERLPGVWNILAHFNPFFYMIDGFRYAFTGHAEAPLIIGAAIMIGGNLCLGTLGWLMFRTGYRLRG